ncbi:hypothetical protein Scep_015341 [Stephania cephalantha]|uniref:Uncharacterized protein n=1 Tax=Stephania cephalantha TaxID=152367 RepID=A0AAP0J4F5_9MAGN
MAFDGGLQSKIHLNPSRRRASSKSRRLVHDRCLVGDRSVDNAPPHRCSTPFPAPPPLLLRADAASLELEPSPRRCRRRCSCRAAAETPFLLAGVPSLLLTGVLRDSRATSWPWNRRSRHRAGAAATRPRPPLRIGLLPARRRTGSGSRSRVAANHRLRPVSTSRRAL